MDGLVMKVQIGHLAGQGDGAGFCSNAQLQPIQGPVSRECDLHRGGQFPVRGGQGTHGGRNRAGDGRGQQQAQCDMAV